MAMSCSRVYLGASDDVELAVPLRNGGTYTPTGASTDERIDALDAASRDCCWDIRLEVLIELTDEPAGRRNGWVAPFVRLVLLIECQVSGSREFKRIETRKELVTHGCVFRESI